MFCQKPTPSLVTLVRLFSLLAASSGLVLQAQPQVGNRQIPAAISVLDSNRVQDGLLGPVRRIRTETAKLSPQAGKVGEGPRALLEVTTYAPQGQRLDNKAYPASTAGGTPAGKEEYKYDDKGNVVEMTLRDAAGRILSKEVYAYEFDSFGNWTKMTTSIVVLEADQLNYEPTEITYRMISYYFDETAAKMVKAAASPTDSAVAGSTAAAGPGAIPAGDKAVAATPFGANAGEHHRTAPPIVRVPTDSMLSTNTSLRVAPPSGAMPAHPQSVSPINTDDPPPPAAAAAAPRPVARLISSNITNSKAVSSPKPVYPEPARLLHTTGTVSVRVSIDTAGRVFEAVAVSGPESLRAAALDAAKRARFAPMLIAGRPSNSSGVISYTFSSVPQ